MPNKGKTRFAFSIIIGIETCRFLWRKGGIRHVEKKEVLLVHKRFCSCAFCRKLYNRPLFLFVGHRTRSERFFKREQRFGSFGRDARTFFGRRLDRMDERTAV